MDDNLVFVLATGDFPGKVILKIAQGVTTLCHRPSSRLQGDMFLVGWGGSELPLPVNFTPRSCPFLVTPASLCFFFIAKYHKMMSNFFLFPPVPATLGIPPSGIPLPATSLPAPLPPGLPLPCLPTPTPHVWFDILNWKLIGFFHEDYQLNRTCFKKLKLYILTWQGFPGL